MEHRSRPSRKALPGDVESKRRWIDAVKASDPRQHQVRPAPGTAAKVEPFGPRRHLVEGKDRKIGIEDRLEVMSIKLSLVIFRPFLAETSDGRLVQIPPGHRQRQRWYGLWVMSEVGSESSSQLRYGHHGRLLFASC